MTIIEDRLNEIDDIVLDGGAHDNAEDGMCLLEAASWLAGEPFSDHPECVCPVLGAFGRSWNDALSMEDRNRILKPFIPRLIGTRSTLEVAEKRAWLAIDWQIRTHLPTWLRKIGRLTEHADTLSSTPAIETAAQLTAIQPALNAATSEARAARVAARVAAKAAAWDAAWVAAGIAARYAAWDAAKAAACDAAWDAARVAARAALRDTVVELQASAADLFDRMISVTS